MTEQGRPAGYNLPLLLMTQLMRLRVLHALHPALTILLCLVACTDQSGDGHPPVAPTQPTVLSLHGHERIDPYYWLSNESGEDERVAAYIAAENQYTRRVMAGKASLQQTLYEDMSARLVNRHRSPPTRVGDAWYYREYRPASQYPLYLRSAVQTGEDPQVLLDLNRLAEGAAYYHLGSFDLHPDGRLIAYTEDRVGGQTFTLHIRDVASAQNLKDEITNLAPSVLWSADGSSIYYVALDPVTLKPTTVKQHFIGTPVAEDQEIYREADPGFHVALHS